MLKALLAALGVAVAGLWVWAAMVWLSPPAARPRDDLPVGVYDRRTALPPAASPRAAADALPPAVAPAATVPATRDAIASTGPAEVVAPALTHERDVRPGDSGARQEMRPVMPMPAAPAPTATAAAKPASPQYSAIGGYVLDGDTVVIAPPTSGEPPNSPAEQRRRTRLATDVSKLP